MRILHVYNHFYPCIGGIERYIEDICANLNKRGHKSDVCCLNKCANSDKILVSEEKYKGIKIYRIPYKDLKYYKIAPRVIKIARQYDILHIHGMGFFLDFLSSTKTIHKKPLILSTHGGIFHTENLSLLKKPYFYVWSKQKLKNVDRIIAISRNDEKVFSKISKNVVFISDGIDFEKYSKIKRNPIKRTMVFIGRISPNKRIDRLIEIMSEFKKIGKSYKLYIAGPEWAGEQKKLEELAKMEKVKNNIKFLGAITENKKLDLLSKAEFFISASEYEGFGISVLEAIAAGVPVIVNDIEAFRNFIENGKNGFIVDFSKINEAVKKMEKIEKFNLNKISKEAKKYAKEYDWNVLVEKIEKTYKGVLPSPKNLDRNCRFHDRSNIKLLGNGIII